jgi:hypothetical protein
LPLTAAPVSGLSSLLEQASKPLNAIAHSQVERQLLPLMAADRLEAFSI